MILKNAGSWPAEFDVSAKTDRIYRINKIFEYFYPVNLVNPVEK
jgi:hypothetical protein